MKPENILSPWESEPNEMDFDYAGLKCAMRRNHGGAWCGYVGLPKEHPWYGKGYSDAVTVPDSIINRIVDVDKIGAINLLCASVDVENKSMEIVLAVDVHGGLTFASDSIKDTPEQGLWWFGFDCSHAGDISPNYDFGPFPGDVYRIAEYVKKECESLADQLTAITKGGS